MVGYLAEPWLTAKRGDGLYLVGVPKVGAAVRLDDPEIADAALVRELLPRVHALVPVGSRGAWHEADVLAREAGLEAELEGAAETGSAGPATALVAEASDAPRLSLPVRRLGWLR